MSSSEDRSSKPVQQSLLEAPRVERTGPPPGEGIEVFGLRFKDEEERRAHFKAILAEKLKEPGFREQPGFPLASDEDILRMSDPPWYTACPNPFLAEFVKWYGKKLLPGDSYAREPLAVDTQVGKTDALYKAHGYHTKVPHLAIVPSILHYTEPGDIVLDGFCGSGLMGVAAQWCGSAPQTFRSKLEEDWRKLGLGKPKWGARRAILNDLSPAATFIAQGFNLPFDVAKFEKAAERLLREVEREVGWMYEVRHDSNRKGRINYTVWSEVFACPNCSAEVVFVKEALDPITKRVKDVFPCPSCSTELGKKRGKQSDEDGDEISDALQRSFTTSNDPVTGAAWRRVKFEPVIVNYSVGSTVFERPISDEDRLLIAKIADLPWPREIPSTRFPLEQMAHGSRLAPKGFTHIHHLFLPRAAHAMASLWSKANHESEPRLRAMLVWFVEQAIWGLSLLNRYKTIMHGKTSSSNVNQYLSGVYYVPSQHSECSPWYNLGNRADRLVSLAFAHKYAKTGTTLIGTGSASRLAVPDQSVDYIFTDPPFGENIYYADLNFLVEAWHRAITQSSAEAIVDRAKHKNVHDYESKMRDVFSEYYRALKPNRWLTVVFSNSHNSVWNAIQAALGEAGFVVAQVSSLDKKQRSYRQETSSAVKEDLVVSCYKPSDRLQRRLMTRDANHELAWEFVREHLGHLTRVMASDTSIEVLAERTADSLYDRLVALCLQRHMPVPLSKSEFVAGLDGRFAERDGMWFLPGQVDEYDRRRSRYDRIGQLPLIVTDEVTAIRWIRSALTQKPQKFEDLQPDFMKQTQHWSKSESVRDLRELLEQNFLQYQEGEVPGPIHAYLSSAYHDLRNLPKDSPALVSRALGRWYVADPGRAGDLERRRKAQLLKEFEAYLTDKRKRIDVYRRDAVVTGFQEAYRQAQWARIITVASKLPGKLFEDELELYLLLENAKTQAGVE